MDRGSAAVAGAAALHAAGALAELKAAPLVRIHAAGQQNALVISNGARAVFADGAHQPLSQNAVERGNEVVDLDAHIHKAAQHIHHVVGVDGGKHQVPGQGGVDGDLRRLVVADFAHQNLVRVVAQDRPQPARKGKPLLLVHRNLRNAANLVLHRILDGDDLVFVALDLIQSRVEGGGFSRAGRPSHQHHAVRLADVAAEALQVFVGKTDHIQSQMAKLLAHRFLVQHAEHGIFAMHCGHDGDAEVNQPPLVADPEAAVLGNAALGNVQLAHDLDAAENGGVVLACDGRHGRLQHAVDAVLDDQRIVVGFDVNIGGAALESGEDGGIDQADDGADVFFAGQLLNGDVFIGVFVAGEHVEGKTFAGLVEHALRLLGFFEQVSDLRKRGYAGDDAVTEQPGDLVEHHQARRVRDGDGERVLHLLDGHEVIAEHQFHGDGAQQVMLNLEVLQINEFSVIAVCQSFGLGAFVLTGKQRSRGKRKYRCVGHSGLPSLTSAGLPQREDGQVQRDENEDYDHAHDNEDGRLDESQRGGQRGSHVFLKEFGNRVEHLRQGTGLFAHGNHFRGQAGEDIGLGQGFSQAFAFAHRADGGEDRSRDAPRGDGTSRRLERRHQRQAAGEQRGERARKQSYLVLEPDFAKDGQPHAETVDKVFAALGDREAVSHEANGHHAQEEPDEVVVQPLAKGEQADGHGRQFGAHLVIEHGKLRHHDGQQKDHEPDHQGKQQRRIDERSRQLLANGERDLLEVDVALQHLLQVAGTLAGQQGGNVHDGKAGLRLEGGGKRVACLDAVGNIVKRTGQLGVLLNLRQHLDGAENGQPGADQGKELLIEDEKRLQLDFSPLEPAKAAAGADAEDVVAGMGEAGPQFLGRGR